MSRFVCEYQKEIKRSSHSQIQSSSGNARCWALHVSYNLLRYLCFHRFLCYFRCMICSCAFDDVCMYVCVCCAWTISNRSAHPALHSCGSYMILLFECVHCTRLMRSLFILVGNRFTLNRLQIKRNFQDHSDQLSIHVFVTFTTFFWIKLLLIWT